MVSKTNGGTFAGAVTFSAGLVANTVDINGGTIDGATITGNIVGNASGTAATVTTAAQPAITSVGTLTALNSDSMIIGDTDMTAGHSAIVADRLHIESDSTTAAQFNTVINNTNITHNGLLVQAGNTSTETSFAVRKYSLTSDLFAVKGDGDVTVNTGNLVIGTAGKGITFSSTNTPAQSAGTGSHNTLDDYEEGTFTATLLGGTSNPTTAVTTAGRYTKTGNVVNISITYANANTAGASGQVKVTGLPFTAMTNSPEVRYPLANGMYSGGAWDTDRTPITIVENSSTLINFFQMRGSSSWTELTHNATSGVYMWVNGHYFV